MNPLTKRELWTLIAAVLVAVAIFAGFLVAVTYLRPEEVPRDVVILPAATPVDEIVALGYETHFTGMYAEMFMGAEEQTAISCTAGCVITPTGTYQPLESGGDVTCTLEAAGMLGRYTGVRNVTYTTGSLLWLVNESDTTIVISEGTTAEGTTASLTGATVSLGVSDTLLLFFDSSDWIELSESNN